VDVSALSASDAAVLDNVASGVFDGPVDDRLLREFLQDPRHHLVVARDGDCVVGMASGVHYIHPDKPPELWINEVSVAPSHRRRQVARRLMDELFAVARGLGCTNAWVLTERANVPAQRLYHSLGGSEPPEEPAMFSFDLRSSPKASDEV
jgi:aminoglycoside 6'-N-acetyltransferase I